MNQQRSNQQLWKGGYEVWFLRLVFVFYIFFSLTYQVIYTLDHNNPDASRGTEGPKNDFEGMTHLCIWFLFPPVALYTIRSIQTLQEKPDAKLTQKQKGVLFLVLLGTLIGCTMNIAYLVINGVL